jgi:tetratricopeptide (TPR) repeat protein
MGLMLAGVRGVVAVGGGFPHGSRPSKETRFALFGVAGLADFNYGEVKQLAKDFDSLGLPAHFEVLESGHNWPPKEVCTAALEWFEVLSLREARGEKDFALAQKIFEKRLRQAESEAAKGNLARAVERYEAILRDFADLVDTSKAREQVDRWKSSREFAAARQTAEKREKKRELLDSREQEKLTRVLTFVYSSADGGLGADAPETGGAYNPATGSPGTTMPPTEGLISGDDALAFEKLVAGLDLPGLRRTLDKKRGTDEAVVAERQLQRVFVSTFETARNMEHLKKYRQALMCLEVAAKAAPENGFVQFSLARLLALAGHKDRSLKALEASAEKGFARAELVEQDEALQSLRSEERYGTVLQKMRAAKPPPPAAP